MHQISSLEGGSCGQRLFLGRVRQPGCWITAKGRRALENWIDTAYPVLRVRGLFPDLAFSDILLGIRRRSAVPRLSSCSIMHLLQQDRFSPNRRAGHNMRASIWRDGRGNGLPIKYLVYWKYKYFGHFFFRSLSMVTAWCSVA